MKNKTIIPKTVCAVWREDSHGYGHLVIAFYSGASLERYCPNPFLKLRYQCDKENVGWYGLHTDVSRDSAADMLIALDAAKPVLRKIAELPSEDPASVIAAVNVPRWIEDRRCSQWMPISDVAGPDLKRWMSWTDASCSVSAMATDEDDAKQAIMAEYARHISERNYGNYGAKLEAWIAAGKPVRMDDWAKSPDTTDIETLLQPLRVKSVEQIAA